MYGAFMFNLDQAIADWRRRMAAGGVKTPVPLEELETHLREDIGSLVSAGMPAARAFQLAVSRLGNPGPLRTEFDKLESTRCWPVTIGSWLWLGAIVVLAIDLYGRLAAGKMSLLLFAHIVILTAGYGGAFLAGGFGICYVCYRSFRAMSPARQQSLAHAVLLFSCLSAGLVIAGLVLGMLWSGQNRGRYWGGSLREIGALCAAVWLIVLGVLQRCRRVSERAAMLMCIGGNVVVSLAWFGAGIMAGSPSSRLGSHWFLAAFLGMNLLFLVMGMAPARMAAESQEF
jgi:hypothetical protein